MPYAPNLVDGLDLAREQQGLSLLHRDGDGGLVELGLLARRPAFGDRLLEAAPLVARCLPVDARVLGQVEIRVRVLEGLGDVRPLA